MKKRIASVVMVVVTLLLLVCGFAGCEEKEVVKPRPRFAVYHNDKLVYDPNIGVNDPGYTSSLYISYDGEEHHFRVEAWYEGEKLSKEETLSFDKSDPKWVASRNPWFSYAYYSKVSSGGGGEGISTSMKMSELPKKKGLYYMKISYEETENFFRATDSFSIYITD